VKKGVGILLITDSFPPVSNGVSYVTGWLYNRLRSEGFDVGVITSHNAVNASRVYKFRVFTQKKYQVPLGLLKNSIFKRIRSIIDEYDVVHVHNYQSMFSLFFLKFYNKIMREKKTIYSPHFGGTFFTILARLVEKPYALLFRRTVDVIDIFHFVSFYEKNIFIEKVMKNAEIKNRVIFNPIMRDAFQYDWSPPDPPVLTYAGRLDHYKHPELLIEIAYMLNKLYNLK
jgi:glycosyltransferase involved in cell wall biosynthesis